MGFITPKSMSISIPGNTIAKKNSQRVVKLGKRYAIRPSKAYDAWEKQALEHLKYIEKPGQWPGRYPVRLHLFFYRKTRAKFDIENMISGSQDVLQKAGVVEDDSMNHIIPVYDGWAIDRKLPRTVLTLEEASQSEYFRGDVTSGEY